MHLFYSSPWCPHRHQTDLHTWNPTAPQFRSCRLCISLRRLPSVPQAHAPAPQNGGQLDHTACLRFPSSCSFPRSSHRLPRMAFPNKLSAWPRLTHRQELNCYRRSIKRRYIYPLSCTSVCQNKSYFVKTFTHNFISVFFSYLSGCVIFIR